MKRENRVRKHSDFTRIIKQGQNLKSHRFAIYYERSDEAETHIGIAVGKRNGGAVARVKAKRQIRAIVAECWSDYRIPLNIVVLVKKEYSVSEFAENKKELTVLLDKIKG